MALDAALDAVILAVIALDLALDAILLAALLLPIPILALLLLRIVLDFLPPFIIHLNKKKIYFY
jgi:hypothetical protein